MIAADTSVVVDYLQGVDSVYTRRVQDALFQRTISIPLVVVTELFSSPRYGDRLAIFLDEIETLELWEGYWERAGKNRSKLKARGLKAKVADALIAQSCIDHNVPLLTRDEDFRHYSEYCGLRLEIA